jgi:hypothetical protein
MRAFDCRQVWRVAFAWAVLLSATSAEAQFQSDGPAVGERYNVEAALYWWSAKPVLIVSSESLGIPGDDVDLASDLGIEQKRLTELAFVLRPALKHKFRIHYLPIDYEVDSVVTREFVFNGLRYRIGLPVSTSAEYTTWRFGYEYDFLYRDRGYLGFLVDLKYTNVDVRLDSAIGAAFTEHVAPIPGFGLVGRGYLHPNVSIGGEWSYFRVPDSLSDEFGGKYLDYNFYGMVNFTRNVGARIGRRSIDLDYFKDLDSGSLNFGGWYFGGVVRY